MSSMRAILCFGALLVPHAAMAECKRPVVPECLTTYQPFSIRDTFTDCSWRMASYEGQVKSFVKCNERASEQALNELTEARKTLSRRMSED